MHPDEQAIHELHQRWIDASEAGDYAALELLIHPDVLFFTPGSEPFGRAAFRASFQHIVQTMRLKVASEVRDIEISGDLASAWGHVKVSILPRETGGPGETMHREGFVLSVYRRSPEDGQWQVWRDANLMIA
jgi:uncharacterized protein (TIGR02246 family)